MHNFFGRAPLHLLATAHPRTAKMQRVGLYAVSFVSQAPQKDAASIPHAALRLKFLL